MREHNAHTRIAKSTTLTMLLLALIGGFSSATGEMITSIEIDGFASDWEGRTIVGTDPAGDPDGDHPDLRKAYAFLNEHALYLFVELESPAAPLSHFDIEIQAGTRMILISWTPGDAAGYRGDVTVGYDDLGPTAYSRFGLADGLEARIDLRDLESPTRASLLAINVIVHRGGAEWVAADQLETRKITPAVNEVDPAWAVSDEPHYTLARRYRLPLGWACEVVYAPPVPNLTGIDRSADGTIFLQEWGVNEALWTLDLESGAVQRIIQFPYGSTHFETAFAGPEDTVFVPVAGELWQVASDGGHTVWGGVSEGTPLHSTSDGRILGRLHGAQGVLVEFFPDGTYATIAAGFDHIFDVVSDSAGNLFLSDWETGVVSRVEPDGSIHEILASYTHNESLFLAISPSGELFMNHPALDFCRLDPFNGAYTRYAPFLSPCSIAVFDFVFIGRDEILFIEVPLTQVVRANLLTGQTEILVGSRGAASPAVAIGPDSALYLGASGCDLEAPRILRMEDDGTASVYASGLGRDTRVLDLAFGPAGELYAAADDLYRIAPGGGQATRLASDYGLASLAVDPTTGHLFGSEYYGSSVVERLPDGRWIEHPIVYPKQAGQFRLAFTQDGELLAYCNEKEREWSGPIVERWVLEMNPQTGRAAIIYQHDREGCCVMADLTVDYAGNVYWLANPDFCIYRIDPSGVATVFARGLPTDCTGITVNQAGDVYVSGPSGVFRMYQVE